MKKRIYRILAFALIFAMLGAYAVPAKAADAGSIGSLLDAYAAGDGAFVLSNSSRFYVAADSEPSGSLLQTVQLVQRQFALDGHKMEIVWGPADWAKTGDIVIVRDTASGTGADGYRLDVNGKAVVTAADVDGILYGANTLQKIIRACGTSIQAFTASDAPDTKERTVQLDVARKYFTKDWICNFIREMSWMGYNTLSLHFSEDGGFRADFWDPAYYMGSFQPENDFTWLCGSHLQSWVKDPYRNDPDAGKYLTTAELIEIINVAKEYHIDIIPSFDSPAHMDYITWKYEQHYKEDNNFSFKYNGTTYYAKDSYPAGCINYTGTTGESSPTWKYTTMELRDEQADYTRGKNAKAFVFSIYEDIADFFKVYAGSTKFSIGADEVNLSATNAWSYSYFPGYINQLNQLLNSKGYTVRMFNDFIKSDYLSQFDSNIEIQYWNSPYGPTSGSVDAPDILTVQQMVNNGRKLYNCIQTNTYFVLRITAGKKASDGDQYDARSDSCRSWTFYHSDEDSIYNEWYPADISEHGVYSEDVADVPAGQIGGGYFLLWNDYAAVANESQVWNGINSDGKWNVIDRMWSNTIKMWNWDVNNSVNYNTYAGIRDKFGDFPGYTGCSSATSLPSKVAVTQAYLADHSALTAALANKVSSQGYTADSYAVYEAAYAKAEALNQDHGATEEAMMAAINILNAAKEDLVLLPAGVTIQYVTMIDGKETVIRSDVLENAQGPFSIYIPALPGYTYLRCEGATYVPTPSGDGTGYIRGTAGPAVMIKLWYENKPDASLLNNMIGKEISNQGQYTDATWKAYQAALKAAKDFAVTGSTMQSDIDALLADLEAARNALAFEAATEIISIEKLTKTARLGKQVGLRITTSPDVQNLSIDGEALTLCVGRVQEGSGGEFMKLWLVYFPADEAGTFTYTLRAGDIAQSFSITVQ